MPAALAGREGRHLHQHPPADPVARQGGRGAGREPFRDVVHLPPRSAPARSCMPTATAPKDQAIRALTWDYPVDEQGEPDRRGGAEGDQRLHLGRQDAAVRLQRAEGRRLHRLRLLDLQRRLPRGRPQPRALAQARSARTVPAPISAGASPGPATAASLYNRASADPDGKPWSERKRLMWWDEGKGKWAGPDAIDFAEDKRRTTGRTGRSIRPGMDALDGHSPFIMIADGKAALFVPSGLKDGPLPDALRAGRIARSATRSIQAAVQPGRRRNGSATTTRPRGRRSALPVCADHLPADRAPLGRHADAHRAGHGRIAARGLRRDPAGTGARTRHRQYRLGGALDRARRDRDAARW